MDLGLPNLAKRVQKSEGVTLEVFLLLKHIKRGRLSGTSYQRKVAGRIRAAFVKKPYVVYII